MANDKKLSISANIDDKSFKKYSDVFKKAKKETDELGKAVKTLSKEFKELDKELQNRIKGIEKLTSAFKGLKTSMGGSGGIGGGGTSAASYNNIRGQNNGVQPAGGGGGGGAGIAPAGGGGGYQIPMRPQAPVNFNNMGSQRDTNGMSAMGAIGNGAAMAAAGAQYASNYNTSSEQGLANIAGVRNRMLDRAMGHDISDAYVAQKNYNQTKIGMDRNTPDNNDTKNTTALIKAESGKLGGMWGKVGEAIADGFGKVQEKKADAMSIVGMESKVQKNSALAGKTGLQNTTMYGEYISDVVDTLSAGDAGGKTATSYVKGALKVKGQADSYAAEQGAGLQAEAMTNAQKELSHQQIALMQNFVNKAGMVLQGDLRAGGGLKAAWAGAGQGMGTGEAIQYGVGVNDAFGQGMGGGLSKFGLGRRAKGGNAGLMATLGGVAGMGIGGDDLGNDARSARGVKALSDAISLGTSKGMSDPQSMEALAGAIAAAISRSGGSGGFSASYVTAGMDAGNFNPEVIRQRQEALGSFSGGEQGNSYFRSMALAGAQNQLGSNGSYDQTQALGGSLQDLIGGAGGDKFRALGIGDDQVKTQIYDRLARVIGVAGGGSGDNAKRLKGMFGGAGTSEELVKNVLNSDGGVDLVSALTEGSSFGDFASNKKFFGGMKGSLERGGGSLDLEDIKSSAKAAESTMAVSDARFLTEGTKELKTTLKTFAAWSEQMAHNPPPPEGDSQGVVNVFKALEELVKSLNEGGGAEAVTEKFGHMREVWVNASKQRKSK